MTSLTDLESEMNLSIERPAAVILQCRCVSTLLPMSLRSKNMQKQKRNYLPDCSAGSLRKVARWREHSSRVGGGGGGGGR